MKFRGVAILGSLLVLMLAFRSAEKLFQLPEHFPHPVYDLKKNPLTKDKVELGRRLFYDPVLSADSTISCASCHSPFNAFAHIDHDLSHGIHDIIGNRNAPAIINLAWQKELMWDGAVNHLDVQALAPMTNEKEMGETLPHVLQKLRRSESYRTLFQKAYGDTAITTERLLLSLAQFQLTLVSAGSKYDSVMLGKAKFTPQQERGYSLFRANCSSCHTEPLFSNYSYRNNGLKVDTTLNDFGRYTITHIASDSLLFKVPTLRNIEYTYPYMHDGRFRTLYQVLDHYNSGIVSSSTLSPELRNKMSFSPNEKTDIVAFLMTLSDRQFIFNPMHSFPIPDKK